MRSRRGDRRRRRARAPGSSRWPEGLPRLQKDWLLIADRGFLDWADSSRPVDTGAQLLWRVKADLTLPVLAILPDGSYSSVLVSPKVRGKAREALLEAARAGEDLDEDKARHVRVVKYEIPDRDGDRQGRGDRPGHHDHRNDSSPGAAARGGLPPALGTRNPGTPSSRRTCAAPGKCCGPRARTWSARKSTATCSPTMPCPP